MPDRKDEKLKLGKGAAFVQSRLKYLPQEEDIWETDFFPVPPSEDEREFAWMGLVLSHAHDYDLAQQMFEEPPGVNALARLLADAMQRPMSGSGHRPTALYLRARPEWAELLPHLKQLGIETISQERFRSDNAGTPVLRVRDQRTPPDSVARKRRTTRMAGSDA
jgi:hypothetical protein